MLFSIVNPELIYSALKEIKTHNNERGGRLGVYIESEGEKHLGFPGFGFQASPLNLPSPLRSVGFAVKSRGGYYSLGIPILAVDESFFNDISEPFGKLVDKKENEDKKHNFSWMSLSSDGTGYILRDEEVAVFSIHKPIETGENSMRIIATGEYGTQERSIPDKPEKFIEEISILEQIASRYVNAIYETNKISLKGRQSLTFALNCFI